jgi:hypothetical protein
MKRSSLLFICLRYGVVAGVLAVIVSVTMFYLGRHPMLVSPFLDFRVLLLGVFIFFSLKEFRNHQEGVLYFWQGLLGGLCIVLLTTGIGSIGLLVFGSLVEGFVAQYIEQMTTYLKTFAPDDIKRIGQDVYNRNLALLPTTNISTLVMTYFFQGLIIGFFVSIILSVTLRRQPKT